MLWCIYEHCVLSFTIISCSSRCVHTWVFFTRGYPFTLSGDGYGEKVYPLTGMGTGDGQAQGRWVRVWGNSTRTQILRVPSLVMGCCDEAHGDDIWCCDGRRRSSPGSCWRWIGVGEREDQRWRWLVQRRLCARCKEVCGAGMRGEWILTKESNVWTRGTREDKATWG